jgi:hypothetical protein
MPIKPASLMSVDYLDAKADAPLSVRCCAVRSIRELPPFLSWAPQIPIDSKASRPFLNGVTRLVPFWK